VLSQYVEERYSTELLGGNPAGVCYLLKDRVADVERVHRRGAARRRRGSRARSGGGLAACSTAAARSIAWPR